jgi:hypothetical protein
MAPMKYLLEAMRAFHYVIGITTPKPEHERKILLLWIGIFIALLVIGVVLVMFLIPRVMR